MEEDNEVSLQPRVIEIEQHKMPEQSLYFSKFNSGFVKHKPKNLSLRISDLSEIRGNQNFSSCEY